MPHLSEKRTALLAAAFCRTIAIEYAAGRLSLECIKADGDGLKTPESGAIA
jgi:hypothetical protein